MIGWARRCSCAARRVRSASQRRTVHPRAPNDAALRHTSRNAVATTSSAASRSSNRLYAMAERVMPWPPSSAASAGLALHAADRALRVVTRPERNPGTALDLDLVRALRVNRSAVERRAATIPTRRTVKKEWQAAWLLRAITCMDLTTLQGDDTPTNVLRLCAKAKSPVRPDLLAALGATEIGITVGAVCVYHAFVPVAVEALQGSGIPVAAVSTGFPAGGIRKAKQALDWLILMKEELGDRWLRATLFRLGASALLTDIERQLEHFVTGRYSAAHHHPMV